MPSARNQRHPRGQGHPRSVVGCAVISATPAAAPPAASHRPAGLSRLPPFSLQRGRRRRRGLRLGHLVSDCRLDLDLDLGLGLGHALEGRVQGGLQGGENDL